MGDVTDLPVPLPEGTPVGPGACVRRKVVLFRTAGEWFAVGLERVREVCPRAAVTRVPRAPAQVLGVMNLRGRVVTLVDLGRCLGLSGDGADGLQVVLLDLGDPGLAVGVVAEQVDQVAEVEASAGEAPWGPDGTRGAGDAELLEVGGRVATLLDPRRDLAGALPGLAADRAGDGA